MGLSVLSQASRFNAGSELWILPPLEVSQQTLQVDWYLNFQISQSKLRSKQQRSPELQRLLNLVEWPLADHPTAAGTRLLISAIHQLPCRWVAVIDNPENQTTWTKDLFTAWENLEKPSLRVFLPPKTATNEWFSIWRSFSSFEDMTVVLDS